jgi:hypothetical protein
MYCNISESSTIPFNNLQVYDGRSLSNEHSEMNTCVCSPFAPALGHASREVIVYDTKALVGAAVVFWHS